MFKQALEFDDWRGSQRFLNNNQYAAIIFSKENVKMIRKIIGKIVETILPPVTAEEAGKPGEGTPKVKTSVLRNCSAVLGHSQSQN